LVKIFIPDEEHQKEAISVNLEKLGESDLDDFEKISCDYYDEKFFIPANLDLHMSREHQNLPMTSENQNQTFQAEKKTCSLCKKVFKSKSQFNLHLRLFHKDEGVICKFIKCLAPLKTNQELEMHLKNRHQIEGKPFECKVCKCWYPSKKSLIKHTSKSHSTAAFRTTPTFLCLFCSASFGNSLNLYKHTKKNHGKEAIKCQQRKCIYYFKSSEQMKEHLKNVHSCKFCGLTTFANPKFLNAHLKEFHSEKKCKFAQCLFYIASTEELENHLKEKHYNSEKSCDCVYCGKTLVGRKQRCNHVRKFHSLVMIKCDSYKCKHLFFKTSLDLDKHKKEEHVHIERFKKSIKCLFCPKTICDRMGYTNHIKQCHSSEALRCRFQNCLSYFKRHEDLEKHNQEKHVEKYTCAFCNYAFAIKDKIHHHIQNKHFPRDKKCPLCPKMFGREYGLKSHIKTSHGPKKKCPHCHELISNLLTHFVTSICPICSKPFPCKKLANHRRGCKEKKELECGDCGRKFNVKCYLKYHIIDYHILGKASWKGVKCKFCGTCFESLKFLKKHQICDHPEILVECDLCEKKFASAKYIEEHKFRVHGIAAFECKLCNNKFLNNNELSVHVELNHDKDNINLLR